MGNPITRQEDEGARTAAAVLFLIDGSGAPIRDALAGLASEERLNAMAAQLTKGDRTQRATALASYLGRLMVDLDAWSLG